MSDTLEIVFEDIGRQNAVGILLHLLSQVEEITGMELSEENFPVDAFHASKDELNVVFDVERDVTVFFLVNGLRLGNVKISSSLVRLVKYGGKYDVDFSFDGVAATDVRHLMKDLHFETKKIAEKFNVISFFGGLEPANDVETQYFCNEGEGPLMGNQ